MLSRESSIHLVFSMIFNQSCRSGTAFKASGELLIRLNRQSYELRELEYLGYDLLYEAIAAKPCLHRFPATMEKYLKVEKYLDFLHLIVYINYIK